MKKKYFYIASVLLTVIVFSSCTKKNEWNTNDAPSVTLDSIRVTPAVGAEFTLTTAELASGKEAEVDTGSAVRLHFSATGGNTLEQISFHDGTWGANVSLIDGTDTIAATPPNLSLIHI